MINKRLLLTLFFILLAIGVWFTVKAAVYLYDYYTLSEKTAPQTLKWSAFEKNNDIFYPRVDYTYKVSDKEFTGTTIFNNWPYRNSWAVDQGAKSIDTKFVWYQPKDPQHSTLQKKFPFKECIYAITIWIIYVYLFWLGAKVKREM